MIEFDSDTDFYMFTKLFQTLHECTISYVVDVMFSCGDRTQNVHLSEICSLRANAKSNLI